MTIIIGFAGSKGSGKDTCADYLVEHFGFTKYAFAEPIKDICRTLFDLSDDQLYGDLREVVDLRYNHTPRQILQKMGTDFCRDMIDPEFWLKYFKRWANRPNIRQGKIVVSDVRFQNELDTIKDLGGNVYIIHRPRAQSAAKKDEHSSENQSLLHAECTIYNDGSLDALYEKIKLLVDPSTTVKYCHCDEQ